MKPSEARESPPLEGGASDERERERENKRRGGPGRERERREEMWRERERVNRENKGEIREEEEEGGRAPRASCRLLSFVSLSLVSSVMLAPR
eukprot:scaffold200059_cov18-Tisochrysis_lutea.AAC.1